MAIGGEALGLSNERPNVFEGGVRVPIGGEASAIGFEIFERDGAIGGAEMRQECFNRHIGVTKVGVGEDAKVARKNSLENLPFELLHYREVVSVLG